ncbi:MAG: exonuclease domain-containing protein [Verrucomicrobia bacterium]|nr:exonuclease domain-containing protein [Verrucomicrobiota bacterium]
MSKSQDRSNIYIWYDTEFSSLDLERSHLLQVAAVITDHTLKRVLPPEKDFNAIVRLEEDTPCDPWVNEHLQPLVKRCRSEEALPIEEVNTRFAAYIDDAVGPPLPDKTQRPLLAGNTLQCDWVLAAKYLPDVIARVHYRIIDVSSWKMHWRNTTDKASFDKDKRSEIERFFPGEYNSRHDAHDAHYDVLASIAEFNFYIQHMEIK